MVPVLSVLEHVADDQQSLEHVREDLVHRGEVVLVQQLQLDQFRQGGQEEVS